MQLTLQKPGFASISCSVTLLILDLPLSSFLLFHLSLLLLTGDRKHSYISARPHKLKNGVVIPTYPFNIPSSISSLAMDHRELYH